MAKARFLNSKQLELLKYLLTNTPDHTAQVYMSVELAEELRTKLEGRLVTMEEWVKAMLNFYLFHPDFVSYFDSLQRNAKSGLKGDKLRELINRATAYKLQIKAHKPIYQEVTQMLKTKGVSISDFFRTCAAYYTHDGEFQSVVDDYFVFAHGKRIELAGKFPKMITASGKIAPDVLEIILDAYSRISFPSKRKLITELAKEK